MSLEMWERISKEAFASDDLSDEVSNFLITVAWKLKTGVDPREAVGLMSAGGRASPVKKNRQRIDDSYLLMLSKKMHACGMSWQEVAENLSPAEGIEVESLLNKINRLRRAEKK